jgi:phage terminase large subunit
MPSSRRQRNMDKFRMMLADPVLFAQTLLNLHVWSKQEEILRSVANHFRTAVKACHASGKTFIAAAAVLWWITTRKEGIAVTTAPTWTQVERLMWGEIRGMVYRAMVGYPKPSATSLQLGPGRYAIGLSTNEGVRFQGFHGDILIVIDEAPGVLPEIYEAIEGIRAGGDVRVLALGNPIISSGPFYDAFTANREGWNLITISAFDTPNLQGVGLEPLLAMPECDLDNNSHPYLTTRRWVKEKYAEWGPAHPLWESRVLGNFPMQSEDALLSLTWLEQAKLRTDGDGDVVAGLDVAGPGEDETVLCVRQGPRIVLVRSWTRPDPRGEVLAALAPFRSRLKKVNVDTVGIGYYMAQHLRDDRLPVNEVNVGQAARNAEKYSNLKAEIYWKFRESAMSGELAGLSDEKAIAQLAGIRYCHNSRGQIVIESKQDARKRGVKSPDRAEAIILAYANTAPVFGVLEYYRKEAEKLQGRMKSHDCPTCCPRCGNGFITKHGDYWRCQCGATGVAKERPIPSCPKCGSNSVMRVRGGWLCTQCDTHTPDHLAG